MKHAIFWTAVVGLSLSSQALTLDEALSAAAENSPELRAARAEARAASAEIRSAAVWANPELGFEAEGLGGDYNGADSAEYTLSLSQEFPTSGKNRKARAVATAAADAARWSGAEAGLDFQTAVRLAFIDAHAAEEILTVREQQLVLAEEFAGAAGRRHQAGAASELEVLRAGMMMETVRGERLAAEKAIETARQKLARLTGLPTLGKLDGDFFQGLEKQIVAQLHASHPTLQYFQTLEKQAHAEVALAKRSAIPDVTFGAGARYEENGDVQSYLLFASIPLPLWNRGRADVLAAGFRVERAVGERQLAARDLEGERAEMQMEFELAVDGVARYRTVLLPQTERAVELVQEGYAAGRYGWLEQVEVQQMLAETRMGAIEAQRAALRAQAQLLKFYTENE
ncbi:MAG: TolC family protein [Verrucomicrobia bacterium]|nr:TolC family protein [Verrucomicrobiota bacterium]